MYGRRRRRPGFWSRLFVKKRRKPRRQRLFRNRRIVFFRRAAGGRRGRAPMQLSVATVMLLFAVGIFTGGIIYFVAGTIAERGESSHPPQRVGDERFAVELGYEVEQERLGLYRLDAQLPKIVSGFAGADRLGAEIAADFHYVIEPGAVAIREAFYGWREPQITVRYTAEQNGDQIVITVTLRLESDYSDIKQIMVYQYGYDVKKQETITFDGQRPHVAIE